MRSVALLIAPLLTLLLYSGPALAGQRSSQVVIVNRFASRPIVVAPHPRVVVVPRPIVNSPVLVRPLIVQQPIVTRSVIVARPIFVRPFVDRQVFVDSQALIVRPNVFASPFIVGRTFVPQCQVPAFDDFGWMH